MISGSIMAIIAAISSVVAYLVANPGIIAAIVGGIGGVLAQLIKWILGKKKNKEK